MNLKKVITLLLTASMAAGSMMGCGSSAETKTASSVAVPSAAVSTEAAKTTSSTAPAKTAADNKRYDGVTITLLKDSDTVADGIKAVIAAAEKNMDLPLRQKIVLVVMKVIILSRPALLLAKCQISVYTIQDLFLRH